MRLTVAGLVAAAALGGCAGLPAPGPACSAGETRGEIAQLFFGRNIGEALGVSDEDFRRFIDETVTPRFPDGLTVTDAQGQWRDGDSVVREPSKVLTVLLTGKPDDRPKLQAIAETYRQRFRQQAVMSLITPTCSRF